LLRVYDAAFELPGMARQTQLGSVFAASVRKRSRMDRGLIGVVEASE
jgi:hypothetical protein